MTYEPVIFAMLMYAVIRINFKQLHGSACSKPGLKGERRLFVLLILVEFLPSLLTFFSQSVFCIMRPGNGFHHLSII
jgi:hypothetical protein